jgi:hypothetical protein
MSNRNATDTNNRARDDREDLHLDDRDNREQRALPAVVRKRPLAPMHGNRPVGEDTVKFMDSDLPNNRPVEVSHLTLVDSNLPKHRPVQASDMKVVGTVAAYGSRPVAASSLDVVETITLSGHRPVTANTLVMSNSDWLPSNRPVASNDLGEDSNLMGYLD